MNLVENARDALTNGRTLRIFGRAVDGGVELIVEDDGPGLGLEPEKVFEPFYTTKLTGAGLGLTNCRKICEAHGGRIMGENRAEGGARFTVFLPGAATA